LNFTYPKAEHLKSRKAIEQLFKSGQSFFIYPYKVVYQLAESSWKPPEDDSKPVVAELLSSTLPDQKAVENLQTKNIHGSTFTIHDSRFTMPLLSGFAVSAKNFKRAVDRNRIKRLGREAFRLNKHTLTQQLQANHQQLQVFFIFTDKKLPDYPLIETKMQACVKKLSWLARQKP